MSKIEVDAITEQSGTTLTTGGGAGKTVVVDATTVTLGRCGGTVALASGASQTGFGRTGTVDWQTGSIKTATFTAVSGQGFFCDTNGGAFEVDLPAGSAGAIVSIQDYRNTFDTHNLTVDPNGSEKINGGSAGDPVVLSTEGQGVTFVYIDSTVGWRSVQDNQYATEGAAYIAATGGTVTCSGNCKIHTFTGPGTFTVASISSCAAENIVSYLVVGGGGGGAPGPSQGGGGGGGYREVKSPTTPYTASPLDGYPSAPNRVTLTATSFPIVVGGGGPAQAKGSNSTFSTITSAGGGGGNATCTADRAGGSGSGAGHYDANNYAGNTPPTTPSQGFPGGRGTTPGVGGNYPGGGGGGATEAGENGPSSAPAPSGRGGAGTATSITNSSLSFSGGGGGGWYAPVGSGGGGAGSPCGTGGAGTAGCAGTINRGGGGGSNGPGAAGGAGGSGMVVIRYKFK